jgi:signal transduction histidine kinase
MKSLLRQWRIISIALLLMLTVIVVSLYFFIRANNLMKEQLREQLKGIAAAVAVQIDGETVESIEGPQSMQTAEFRSLVEILSKTRAAGENIRFAYILRRTEDPMITEFVADADSLATNEELDVNKNGAVDPDEEGSYPGDLYPIDEIPELHADAFVGATASRDIYVDQWGRLMSGYAPIKRASDGKVVAVLAIDMVADDFVNASYAVFSPLALMAIVIIGASFSVLLVLVAERRQIAGLEKINSERTGLLRLTFHQLGEPLTIMKWSLETLREDTDSPELKKIVSEHLVCMDEGLGRLNSIIDTLQLAEKVDLNTLEYIPMETSLQEVIDNAVGEWSSSLASRKQKMNINMDKNLKMTFDKTLLTLVLRQLFMNAVEYSDEGSDITVDVSKNKKSVQISIADSGCGIPPADMEHLFEKYRRASNAHLKKPDGNGLGLYIARGIVERAFGTIRVESELNKGTTVYVTLPVHPPTV